MNKKVIFLFTPGPMGGAEKIVIYGLKSLMDLGVDIELWTIKETRAPKAFEDFQIELTKLGIVTKVFTSSQIIDLKLINQLRKNLKELKPALVHAHGFKAAFYGKITVPKSTKFIVTHHGKTGHTLKVKVYEFLEEQVMKRSDAVVAVSSPMKVELIMAGVKADKIHQINNFMTSEILVSKITSTLPLEILYVGRLSPEKGCSVLIQAIKKLENPNIKLTVIGDGSERASLESLASELELNALVDFVGFQNNVSERMASSHALIIPSYREGLPLTLIEAVCMGIPVIASKVGGMPDLVTDGSNGYLVTPGDTSELADAILKLVKNFKDLKNSAEEIKSVMIEKFSATTWAEKTLNVYGNV